MTLLAGYGSGAIALLQGTFLDSAHNVFSGNRAGGLGGAISAYSRSAGLQWAIAAIVTMQVDTMAYIPLGIHS